MIVPTDDGGCGNNDDINENKDSLNATQSQLQPRNHYFVMLLGYLAVRNLRARLQTAKSRMSKTVGLT